MRYYRELIVAIIITIIFYLLMGCSLNCEAIADWNCRGCKGRCFKQVGITKEGILHFEAIEKIGGVVIYLDGKNDNVIIIGEEEFKK